MLAIRMNERAAERLGRLGRLEAAGDLVPGLRAIAAGGIEVWGEVVVWPEGGRWAEPPPGRYGNLTGWECFVNGFHLEDEVPITVVISEDGEPSIAEDEQLVLLRQGVGLGFALCRSAAAMKPAVSLRCVVNVNATNGTFRFHRIRNGENWVLEDLDDYRLEFVAVIDAWPRGL